MTFGQVRHFLGKSDRFTLPKAVLLEKIGPASEIRFLPKWCSQTGRDVYHMCFVMDDGWLELFCPIGLIRGEEMILDGWIGSFTEKMGRLSPVDGSGSGGRLTRQLGLFGTTPDDWANDPALPVPPQDQWRVGRQMGFGDDSENGAD